jgi:hypothetical protein
MRPIELFQIAIGIDRAPTGELARSKHAFYNQLPA